MKRFLLARLRLYWRILSTLVLLISLVTTAQFVTTPAYAQDKTDEIDEIFSWATPTTPGCAVTVSQDGDVVVNRAYGLADLERSVPMSPETVFDAGSLVKQFVAASVLLLVEEGELSLSADVRTYIPELPDYSDTIEQTGESVITLDHLLTHTSGIRDWTGLEPLTGGNVNALTLTLRQRGLNFAPGEEWSYSNSGYVLLKEIVARTSGMSFEEFTRDRLFEPLGMKSTQYLTDLREVVPNRALAYEKEDGRWILAMLLDNDRGGGGALLSTASDLLIWNEALHDASLGAFVTEKLQEPTTLNNGRELTYARGLNVQPYGDGQVVWHSGGAAGYHSWLGRLPEENLSIAVLCNSDAVAASALARRIADLFAPDVTPDTDNTETSAAAADVTVADLESKTGLFFSEGTDDPLILTVDDGELSIVGGPALVAISKVRFSNPRGDLFFMSQDEFELHFTSDDAFKLISMEGETSRYHRAQPYSPSVDELESFAGEYTNDETRAIFKAAPGESGLMIQLNDSAAFEFKPVASDTFQRGRMFLRFQRDKDGNVVRLDYSNPVVRNIEFSQLSDCITRDDHDSGQ